MLSTTPFYLQQFHKDGEPLSGGKLYTYTGGSTNAPKATYVDPNGITESPNPIVLSSQGICPQFWCEAGIYKFVLTDASGNEIASRDYVDGLAGGAAITGDHKVMVNSFDTPDYLGNKVYADGGLVVQEVEVDPGVYNLHIFPDSNTLQAKPTGVAGGDLSGAYPKPIVKQLTGVEAALLPITSDFTFSTSPAGTGIGPGRQYLAGVEVRCWVAMDFDGHLRWTRNDFSSTTLDTGLWSRGIGSNWNCIRFLYMPAFASWAWVAGDGRHTYIYYALHTSASYNADGTVKAAAWDIIYYGGRPANLGDIAQGASDVSCFVGDDSYIGRTADFATFTRASPGSNALGGIDTDGYGAWLAIERDQGSLIESTDNGLTWTCVTLISVNGSSSSNLPVSHGEKWGSLNYGYGKWLAAVYNAGSGRISYAYSSDRRSWTTYTAPDAVSFFTAAFDGRKWLATNPAIYPPIWQLLFSEIPAHKRLICEDGLIANGSTFLPDLASAQVLATDRNGLLAAQSWIDLSSYSNASEYRVGGTVVIDSSRNVKGATLWSGGAVRADANGDFTGRNESLTGWLTLNGATRPAWALWTGSIQLSTPCAIGTIDTAGGQIFLSRNFYINASAQSIATQTVVGGGWPSYLSLDSNARIRYYSSLTDPTSGGIISDMALRWSLGKEGGMGCFGVTPPTSRPNITGSRGGSAETALLTALAATGIIQDSTTLKGASFACMYRVAAGASQSIPTGTTYTKVTPFDTNMGDNVNSTPDQANDQIIAGRDGTYQVDWTRTYTVGSANVQWHVAIFVNGVVQPQTVMETKSGSTATSTYACLAVQVQALAGQAIDVRVYHDQGSSVNLTYEHATLSITAIDAGT